MKVLIAGDFCPQNRATELFEKGDYQSVLGSVKHIVTKADYSIVNFECSVTKGGEKPISKIGPNLQCSEKGIEALKWAEFKCVSLANNHFYDYGNEGVTYTLNTCNKYGLDIVGGGVDLNEASKILYKQINGQSLAIINCCEHEFSIATSVTGGSNPLNPIQQYYAIKEAKTHAKYVLIIVHGGNEHYQLPSLRMKELYRFFIDAGADAVVNHHQHCYSGYELYREKPIFYGLGNFCFDNKNNEFGIWNEGFMVMIDFNNDLISFELYPFHQCYKNCGIYLMNNDDVLAFNKKISELNAIINDDEKLKSNYETFIEKTYSIIKGVFEPYQSRFMSVLLRHNLLPTFINREKKLLILSFLQCESHIPKVFSYLKIEKDAVK